MGKKRTIELRVPVRTCDNSVSARLRGCRNNTKQTKTMVNHQCLRGREVPEEENTELLKSYIYSRNKETNNIKLGTKQTKNKLN